MDIGEAVKTEFIASLRADSVMPDDAIVKLEKLLSSKSSFTEEGYRALISELITRED